MSRSTQPYQKNYILCNHGAFGFFSLYLINAVELLIQSSRYPSIAKNKFQAVIFVSSYELASQEHFQVTATQNSAANKIAFHWRWCSEEPCWLKKRLAENTIGIHMQCECEWARLAFILTLQNKVYQFHKSSGFQTVWTCRIVVISLFFWCLEARKAVTSSSCFEHEIKLERGEL